VQWQQAELLRGLPALVCWGMRDIAFSHRDLARWTSLLDRAQVHRYERVGHFPPEEAGADLCATLAAFARTLER
jgi:pimeloyl-ACP methyl ester carboxylesterase